MTDESIGFHYTLFTLSLWCSELYRFVDLLRSHIFIVLSADPEAKTFLLTGCRDKEITESV